MTIQRVISAPSTKSVSRGLKSMPSLARRLHYQEASQDRESVQVIGSDGKDLSISEALDRMGGGDHAYTELLSDASVLETQCLLERHPEMEPDEVMREHFAAQARHLEARYFDGEERIVTAIHKEVDHSYHAHFELPDTLEGLKARQVGKRRELDGRNGAAQEAWDKAWREDRKLKPIRNATEREDAKVRQQEYGAELEKLREERAELNRTLKASSRTEDAVARWDARKEFVTRASYLEEKRHNLQGAKIDHFFAARGMEGSLEHLVERDRVEMRHRGDVRQLENIRHGIFQANVREQNRRDREPFKHMNAAERAVVRDNGLARELEVLSTKHAYQLTEMEPGSAAYDAKIQRQSREIEGILLGHEAGKLRDQENDLSQASGLHHNWSDRVRDTVGLDRKTRPKTVANWAATYQTRKELMGERHGLEVRALHAQAEGSGREPSPEALQKLAERHAKERRDLAQEPLRMGVQRVGGKIQSKAKAVARGMAKLPGKALAKLQEAQRKASKTRQHPSMKHAEAVEGAVTQTASATVQGAVKVATTVAVETAKAALHQAKNAAQAVQVTAKAIATGIINPLAGAKEAGAGYAKVGAEAVQTGARDLKGGLKSTVKDAATATKDIAQQGLGALTSAGMNTAPKEVQILAKTGKEALLASIRATRQFVQGAITLNPLQAIGGTASEVAKGGLAMSKAVTGMVAAKLPAPAAKVLDLASKIPVVGLAAKALHHAAELGHGVAKGGGEIER